MSEEDFSFYFSNYGIFPVFGIGTLFLCCCFGAFRLCYLRRRTARRVHSARTGGVVAIQGGSPLPLAELLSYNEFLTNHLSSPTDSNMGTTCSVLARLDVAEPCECFICYQSITSEDQFRLNCHHWVHTKCLLQWWNRERANVGSCPLCRQSQSICLMEVNPNEKNSFVGFYRKDHRYQLSFRIPVVDATRVVVIEKDAVNMAQQTSEMLYSMYLVQMARANQEPIVVEEV